MTDDADPAPGSTRLPDKRASKRRPATGRLELAIHGASDFLVVVDGKPHAARTDLTLSSGAHDIEVRAAGELPQHFAVRIEAGKTTQRDVTWTHATPAAPAPAAPAPAGADNGHELLAPGDAVPRTPR